MTERQHTAFTVTRRSHTYSMTTEIENESITRPAWPDSSVPPVSRQCPDLTKRDKRDNRQQTLTHLGNAY